MLQASTPSGGRCSEKDLNLGGGIKRYVLLCPRAGVVGNAVMRFYQALIAERFYALEGGVVLECEVGMRMLGYSYVFLCPSGGAVVPK